MIPNRHSTTHRPNSAFQKESRSKGESNGDWLERVLKGADFAGGLLLTGGTDLTAFRLRVAQSHVRHDLTPSAWSHVALFAAPSARKSAASRKSVNWPLYEISLLPPRGFGAVAANNGVQAGRLAEYDDPNCYPNIAYIRFAVETDKLMTAVASFCHARTFVDAPQLMVSWLAFLWGAGQSGNPLLTGQALPAAAFVQAIFTLAGLELTPGLATQAACPEAIWQSAKWWHEYYAAATAAPQKAPVGFYAVAQKAAALAEDSLNHTRRA